MVFVSRNPLPIRQQCLPLLRDKSNTGEHTETHTLHIYTHRDTQRERHREKERESHHTQRNIHTDT